MYKVDRFWFSSIVLARRVLLTALNTFITVEGGKFSWMTVANIVILFFHLQFKCAACLRSVLSCFVGQTAEERC